MGKKMKDCSFLLHTSLERDEFIHILLVRGLTGMEFVENSGLSKTINTHILCPKNSYSGYLIPKTAHSCVQSSTRNNYKKFKTEMFLCIEMAGKLQFVHTMEYDSAFKGRGGFRCGHGKNLWRHCPVKDRGESAGIADIGKFHVGKTYICISQRTYGNFKTTCKHTEKGLEGDSPLN